MVRYLKYSRCSLLIMKPLRHDASVSGVPFFNPPRTTHSPGCLARLEGLFQHCMLNSTPAPEGGEPSGKMARVAAQVAFDARCRQWQAMRRTLE